MALSSFYLTNTAGVPDSPAPAYGGYTVKHLQLGGVPGGGQQGFVTNTTAGGNGIIVTDGAGGNQIVWFSERLNYLSVPSLTGVITPYWTGLESAMAVNATLAWNIFCTDKSGTFRFTLRSDTSNSGELGTGDTAQVGANIGTSAFTINPGDRIAVLTSIQAVGTMGAGTVTVKVNVVGAGGSYFNTNWTNTIWTPQPPPFYRPNRFIRARFSKLWAPAPPRRGRLYLPGEAA